MAQVWWDEAFSPGGQLRLLDALPSIVWVADADGHTSYLNAAWGRYTGTPPAEALGTSFGLAIHPDDRGAALAGWADAWHRDQTFRREFRLRRADGEYRWHLGDGRPLPGPGGQVLSWIGTCTDIHDQRAASPRTRSALGSMPARLAALQRLTSLLAGVQDEPGLRDVLFREGLAAFGAAEGTLLVVADGEEGLDAVGSDAPAAPRRLPLDADQPGPEALRRGEALFLPTREAALAALGPHAEAHRARGLCALAAVPFGSGPARGALVLAFPRDQAFGAPERAFLVTLAEQTGQALARARLVAAERRSRQQAEQLHALAAALGQATTVTGVVDAALSEGRRISGAAAGALSLYDAERGTLELRGQAGQPGAPLGHGPSVPLTLETPATQVARSGEARFEATAGGPAVGELPDHGAHATAQLPLSAAGRTLGVLGLSFAGKRDFTVADRAFLGALAVQCAQALERAQLFEAERSARAAAGHSERRSRTLLGLLTPEIWIVDAQGRSQRPESARWWSQLSGQTAEQAQGEGGWGWLAAVHADDRAATRAVWEHALASQQPFTARYRVMTPGGERVIEARGAPHLGGAGEVLEWVGTYTDLTESITAEREVQRARALFEGIAEASPDLLVVFEPRLGRNVYANHRFEEVLGYTPAQITEMGDLRALLLHPEDAARLEAQADQLAGLTEQEVAVQTFRARHRDGEYRWLQSRVVRLKVGGDAGPLLLSFAQDVTEQRRADDERREQTLRLHLALEASGLGLWELNLDSGVITRSEEARRVLGVAAPRADLATDLGRIPPEERAAIQAQLTAALCGSQGRFTLRHRFRGDDGQERWIERHGLLERDSGGVIRRIIGTCEDVSAQVRAEAELHAGKARLEAALEHGQLGLWEYDLEAGTNHWMGAMHALYGLAPGEYAGDAEGLIARIHPDDRERLLTGSQGALAGTPLDEVFRVVWPSGEQRWIRSTARLQRADDGRPLKLLGVNYDFTERRAAELALQDLNAELERRVTRRTRELESILESMPDAVYVGGAGGITRANRAALELLGFADLEDLNQHILQLAERAQTRDPETLERLTPDEEPFLIALGGQASTRDELARHLGSGEDRIIRVAAAPVVLDGEVISAVAVVSDHTERRAQEHALRTLNAQLVRSNTELERFAYITSHDLQEPIRTVASFAGLLQRRYGAQLDDAGRRYLDMLLGGTARMKTLVDDLLTFSRLSGEQVPLRRLELGVPLAEALSRLQARLGETGAQLTHDPLPTVLGDGPQLAQLFQNLLGNALKFRRPGVRPEIHVGATRRARAWHISVADNGIGIEPEYLERIFVMFERLHTRDQFEGTGLGLAICEKVVERHGGRLWARSTPGAGSVFEFTLPVPPPADAEPAGAAAGSEETQGGS